MNDASRTIMTKDGRQIRINETGQPDGTPVIVHHGTPGSRILFPSWIEDARSRHIRLIGFDRAGYGGSPPRPGRVVAGAAADVAAIAQALGLERLAVWGVSGGGPHALACAALLPDLVAAAACLAGLAPYPADGLDWFAGMGEDNIAEFGAALAGRGAIEQFVEDAAPGTLSAEPGALVEAFRTLLGPADVAVLTEEVAHLLLIHLQAGIRGRRDGWVDDDLAFTLPWGFDISEIRIPLLLVAGRQDRFVPFSHAGWLATRIPHAETRFLPDDGHLTLSVNRIPEVHEWLLKEMK